MAKLIISPFSGVKHLPGSGLCCFVTLCGEVDAFEEEGPGGITVSKEGIEAEVIPNCSGCIDAAREVFASITKKELKGLK